MYEGPAVFEYPLTTVQSPGYWPSYTYSGLSTSYDPYLSSHYDYSQYYPATSITTSQETMIETPETITSAATTEDITFAEAFTALANFEPNIATEETSTQTDVNARQSAGFETQHLQTFNEINSGGFSYYLHPAGGGYPEMATTAHDQSG